MININNIFFFWEGSISKTRLEILQNCIYSTRIFNPDRPIYLVSNSINADMIDPIFNIKIYQWNDSMFDDIPIPKEHIEKYYINSHPRELSDLMRLVLLYKFGGSYIDTDDLAIKSLPSTNVKNIVCRSYDPHTCHYNKLTPEDCINGVYREINGYEHIPIFPRNDCWLNFEFNSIFIYDLLSNKKIVESGKAIYIGDNFSWQSLTLETCKKHIDSIGSVFNLGLTLFYVYEDFVAGSSYWDRCINGGEMCDLWNEMEGVQDYEWGFYKCNQKTALAYLEKVLSKYPFVSHLWLHSKDMNADWMSNELPEDKYQVSTWIYDNIKNKIKKFKNMNELKEKFSTIYDINFWQSSESRSGGGSTLHNTQVLRNEMVDLFKKFNIKSMLDIPCGDFHWMKEVDLSQIDYTGADIVDDLIASNKEKYPDKKFEILDITEDELPEVDLVFVRDCFVHLNEENIFKSLANIKKSKSKYLLATSFTKFNSNPIIRNGDWRCLNLMVDPFFLNPLYLINEDCKEGYPNYNDKCMILFDLTKFDILQKSAKVTPQAFCVDIPKK